MSWPYVVGLSWLGAAIAVLILVICWEIWYARLLREPVNLRRYLPSYVLILFLWPLYLLLYTLWPYCVLRALREIKREQDRGPRSASVGSKEAAEPGAAHDGR
jgi:hypothetical protein